MQVGHGAGSYKAEEKRVWGVGLWWIGTVRGYTVVVWLIEWGLSRVIVRDGVEEVVVPVCLSREVGRWYGRWYDGWCTVGSSATWRK